VALALSKSKLIDSNVTKARAIQKDEQRAKVFMELTGFIK
jgi:hypothetical protein